MSTIKSSNEHLTFNADGSAKEIRFQANGTQKASISSAGAFTSTTIDATVLTGALPAISGASLTNLPADSSKLPLAGGTMTGAIDFGDNVKANFGASDDLQIYHDGSHSYIKDTGTGDLYIQSDEALKLTSKTGVEKYFVGNRNSSVQIYYDNVEKLATTSTGIDVTGGVTTTGARSFFAPASENFAIGVRHATGGGALYFGAESSSSTPNGGIYNSGGSQILGFGNDRNVTIPGGNLVIGTSGKGIDFSANGNASGMTSEVLDDYEEGTWTPVLSGSSGSVGHTVQGGWYVKVGKLCHVGGTISWSSAGSNANTWTIIAGLPFTTANERAAGSVGALNGFVDSEDLSLVADPGGTSIYVIRRTNTSYNHNNTVSTSGNIYGFGLSYSCA